MQRLRSPEQVHLGVLYLLVCKRYYHLLIHSSSGPWKSCVKFSRNGLKYNLFSKEHEPRSMRQDSAPILGAMN